MLGIIQSPNHYLLLLPTWMTTPQFLKIYLIVGKLQKTKYQVIYYVIYKIFRTNNNFVCFFHSKTEEETWIRIFEFGQYIIQMPQVFHKIGVLKNFSKLVGKHLCQVIFFNEVAGLRSSTFFIKRTRRTCFSVSLTKVLR